MATKTEIEAGLEAEARVAKAEEHTEREATVAAEARVAHPEDHKARRSWLRS